MSTQSVRTDPDTKGRGPAIAGALAGLGVVIALVAVFVGVKVAGPDKPAAAGSAAGKPSAQSSAPEPPAAEPSAADNPAVESGPLSKPPTLTAGTGKVDKIKITPIVQGTGPVVQKGQTLTVNYVVATYKDGKVIDSSWSRGQPFSTPIGVGQVIQGWDQSIPGQHLGSRLQIDVPAALAYGAQQGDLRFVVDLLAAQ